MSDAAPYPDSREAWFDPAALYAHGFIDAVTTALRLFPGARRHLEQVIAWVAPRRAIEVGPGDRPLIAAVPVALYLDLSPYFLRGLGGLRVCGSLLACPLRPDAADLVVAADVFTHIVPADRPAALEALLALAPRVLIFNNENGTPGVERSRVPRAGLVEPLEARGYTVRVTPLQARSLGGVDMQMQVIYAVRRGASPQAAT